MRLFARVFSSSSLLFGCASLLVGSLSCVASSIYSVQPLGSLGSGAATLAAMNSSGVAVGSFTDSAGNMVPATFMGGVTNALTGSGQASGVNASGTIIGTTYSGNSPSVTEWVHGGAQSFGLSGYGSAVNDTGQIAGGYITADNSLHAYIGTGTTIRDLGTLGGNWSSVAALNASGQAAGTSSTSGSAFHAFFWDGVSMQDLGTLGGANSYANATNSKGQVAGTAQTSLGYLNAFSWSGSGMVDLGTLGGSTSAAYGVNDAGQVVGYSYVAGNTATHAFLESGGVMLDLNSLLPTGSDWTVTAAYGIDNLGDILATASQNGSNYAVELMQPQSGGSMATPEPAAILLAGLGLLTLSFLDRRRTIALACR